MDGLKMKRASLLGGVIGLAASASLLSSCATHAQTGGPISALVVTSCGAQTYPVGFPALLTQLANGEFCTNSTGGGGGSNAAAGPTGSAVPASAGYTGFSVGGILTGVSAATPFPVAVISGGGSNASIGTIGASGTPTGGTYIAGKDSVTSTTFDGVTVNNADAGLDIHISGGSIANTSFGISGTLPAFASTPTVNAGTGFMPATGGTVGISGTLPAFASPPSFTLGAGSVAAGAYVSGSVLSGALAAGAIVDIGTGASPAANTVNANLQSVIAAAQAPLAAQTGTTTNIGNTGGLGANNATAVGNPETVAGFAQTAEPTLAAAGQTSALATDLAHKLINLPYANPENFVQGTAAAVATTPGTSLLPSAGTGLFNYITSISCFNSGSSATTVVLTNGSGGTTFWQGYAAATGGGFTISFPTPIGGKSLTAATAVFAFAGTSTTSLSCNASGYKGS
jgi:hypothetical protein